MWFTISTKSSKLNYYKFQITIYKYVKAQAVGISYGFQLLTSTTSFRLQNMPKLKR